MILFAYNFPHKKTQDFIFYCQHYGIKIDLILAADAVKLNIPKSTIRSKVKHQALIHPKELADSFNIEYLVVRHNSDEALEILKSQQADVGLIAGARILKDYIIAEFSKGVINFHPGLIPESRGLDALFWSIHNMIPLAVTSHIIDKKVDAGKILEIQKIEVFKNDTLFDLAERLYETQLTMIPTTLKKLLERNFLELTIDGSTYNKKMPAELEAKIPLQLSNYLSKFGK